MHHEQFVPANFVHRNQIFNRLLKRLKRLEVFQVSDVLAHEGLPVYDERNGVLQIGADGQYRPFGREDSYRARRISASAAEYRRAENSGAGYRIVHSACDRALADQENIGDA